MAQRNDIGQFRYRVRVYAITRTDDGSGGFTRADPSEGTLIDTVWADINPVSAQELVRAEKMEQDVSHRMVTRYRTDIVAGQTVMDEDNVDYYVVTVHDLDRRKRYLKILLREGGPL